MTEKEIIKAIECCSSCTENLNCDDCSYNDVKGCSFQMITDLVSLIERQNAKIADLEYKLAGVMYSVDKWLDDDELKQNEVIRAAAMREKTLRIVEGQQAEIESLKEAIAVKL